MKLCVGIVGEIGGGKGTLTELFYEILGDSVCSKHRCSDVLRETATLWSLPHTREVLQKIPIVMDREFGEGTLAKALRGRIENDPKPVVILEGIRWLSDEELIRSFSPNLIIAIVASEKTRFERIRQRTENQGEKGVSFEQFRKESEMKTETSIKKIIERADIVIENEGSIEDLKERAHKLVKGYFNDHIN